MTERYCAHCGEQPVGRRKKCPACLFLVCALCHAASTSVDCRSYAEAEDNKLPTCANCGDRITGSSYTAYQQSLAPVGGTLAGVGRIQPVTVCRSCILELAEMESEDVEDDPWGK